MSPLSSRARRALVRSRLAIATSLFLCGTNAFAVSGVSPHAASQHLLVPKGTVIRASSSAELVHDYGAYQLWRIAPGAQPAVLAGTLPADVGDDRRVALPSGMVDPVTLAASADATTKDPVQTAELYIVQFVGPLLPEWLEQIRATGATPIQYIDHHAYLVLARESQRGRLADLARSGGFVRYAGPLAAGQKIATDLSDLRQRLPGQDLAVNLVLADHADAATSRARIEAAGTVLEGWSDLRGMHVIGLRASPDAIDALAALGDVMSINVRGERERLDEVQAQIIAGALNGSNSGPAAPGYLPWLTGFGFPTDPAAYPNLAIVDDGIGDGTTVAGAGDERLLVDGTGASRVYFAVTCNGVNARGEGHGHINATIAGGYEPNPGAPFRLDPNGYLRGQGINPYVRIANFDIFGSGGTANCGTADTGVIQAQAAQDVEISSNSWGYIIPPFGFPQTAYIAASRAYDLGVRDSSAGAGNRPLMVVFAAGNSGASGVSSPGNSKNVLTVGASENQRPNDEDGNWTDGCGSGPIDADHAMDVADFSSLGPAVGSRVKPDVIAPGTHIQGSASTSPDYPGTPANQVSVCDKYRPSGQTEFAASSGTSHSTPAVAGVATLYHALLEDELGAAPSPAMAKAYMIAHPTYLTGVGAGGNLPSNAQGYGMPNLADGFDPDTDRYLADQATVFTAAGQSETWFGSVADPSEPVRVVLAWTDAAGAADSTSPSVNNLDLTVTLNGTPYRGNVFSGAFSTTGGSADVRNNVEAVFLPAGTTGTLTIEINATAINGDAIPGNASALDQDFALVVVNGSQTPTFFVDASPATVEACGADGASWDVDVGAVNGYSGAVSLSTTGLPGFALPVFAPPSGQADPGFVSTLSVATAGGSSGSYPFTVDGSDGITTRTDAVTLLYSSVDPDAPTLAAPIDDATAIGLLPTLSWAAASEAVSYTVEVATDSGFGAGTIVASAEVTGTSYTLTTPLAYETEFFWRVRASNYCGDGDSSEIRSFTTRDLPPVLLVDDDNNAPDVLPAYVAAAEAVFGAGNYAVVDTVVDGEPGASFLAQFGRVVWFSGDTFGSGDAVNPLAGPTAASEAVLSTWLDGGACLLLSSQDYFFDRDAVVTPFMANYLGVNTMTNDTSSRYTAVAGQNLYTGLGGALTFPTGFANWIDYVTPRVEAGVAQSFRGSAGAGANQGAGVSKLTANWFTTFVPFPLENLPVAQHAPLLQRFVDTCPFGQAPNNPPEFTSEPYGFTVLEEAVAGTSVGSVVATDADVGQTLSYAITAGNTGNAFAINPSNGTITVATPAAVQPGTPFALTVVVTDTRLGTDTTTVTITVTNVPDAPVADNDAYTTAEDTTLTVAAPGVLVGDVDADGDVLSATAYTQPAHGSLTALGNGGFSYEPDEDYCSATPDTFTYRASDGALSSSVATVSITVTCVNDEPVASTIDDASVVADEVAALDVSDAFSEPEGQALSFSATGLPASLSIAASTGVISGTPVVGEVGSYTVTVTATDPQNATAQASFTLEVVAQGLFYDGFEE
jgi:VCBS repeat-containing protein